MGAHVTQASTATDWIYKAEGAVNVVYRYGGDNMLLRGMVLRVPKLTYANLKAAAHNPVNAAAPAALLQLESENFQEEVVAPAIGAKYFAFQAQVSVASTLVEALDARLGSEPLRPPARSSDLLDRHTRWALIMEDATLAAQQFETYSLRSAAASDAPATAGSVLAVELKPKWGMMPSGTGLAVPAKTRVCRFCMHQRLKLDTRSITRMSAYCPLDLYSADVRRMRKALHAMVDTPQNNIRVFSNGDLVFEGVNTQFQSAGQARKALASGLAGSLCDIGHDAASVASFVNTIVALLHQDDVLTALQHVQEWDTDDVERLYPLYERFLEASSELSAQDIHKLRNFLVATAVKDCSIILSFSMLPRCNVNWDVLEQAAADRAVGSLSAAAAQLSSDGDMVIVYSLAVVDVDGRGIAHMPRLFKLDQQISHHYADYEARTCHQRACVADWRVGAATTPSSVSSQ